MRIRIAAAALLALAAALLWAGAASAEGPFTLEGRTASSLTVSWSWGGQAASAYDLAWRARGGDDSAAWRSVRKTAAQRRHTISELEAGVHYIVRVRVLDSNDRSLADLRGVFATSSAAAEGVALDLRLRRGLAERLTLELVSSRELCTAGTLTEISWAIAGGTPPYSLQIEGASVDADTDNIRINCGALTEVEATDEEAALAARRITATVTDARGVRREATIEVARARALPAPQNVRYHTYVGEVIVIWDEVIDAGSQSPVIISGNGRRRVTGVIRTRANRDGAAWSYQTVTRLYTDEWGLGPTSGVQVLSVAAVRHPLETETPGALNWSDDLEYASTTLAQNVALTATHDTLTVSWDRQPHAAGQSVLVWLFTVPDTGGWRVVHLKEEQGVVGRHTVTFTHLPAGTDLRVSIQMEDPDADTRPVYRPISSDHFVRTLPAVAGWTPTPTGPQNLRYTITDGAITILWEEPYPNAGPTWFLTIENPATGASHRARSYGPSWALPADLVVLPDTQYRVTVRHAGVPAGTASILFTTPPASAAGRSRAPRKPLTARCAGTPAPTRSSYYHQAGGLRCASDSRSRYSP